MRKSSLNIINECCIELNIKEDRDGMALLLLSPLPLNVCVCHAYMRKFYILTCSIASIGVDEVVERDIHLSD